jgi:LuxR family maltose regulon positive regulatory protein
MLLEIFDRAPKEMFDQIPQAPATHTRLYISLELFDKAREELEKIIKKLEPNAASPEAHRTLSGCYNSLGYVGMFTSTYTRDYRFSADFEKAIYHSRLSGFQPRPPVSVFSLSCYICRGNKPLKGELEKYLDALEKAVPCIAESMNGATYGMDDLGRGELAMFKGDFASAEPLIKNAIRKAKERDQYEIENRALFYLIRIGFFKGSAEEIPDFLKQLEARLELPCYLNRFTLYDIVTGWFYIQTGQPDKAAPWLKSDFEESDLNSISHGLETLVKARYHLAEKHYSAALAMLKHREDRYGLWSFTMGRVASLALEAVCLYQLHDKENAYRSLKEAYTTALPEEIFMHFLELGKDMRTLTAAVLKDGFPDIPRDWLERINRDAASYAKKASAVSACFAEGRKTSGSGTGLLSPREMEVLKGLSQGLTREEIARVLLISINTVKSTIRNIYNKLGAVNRTDAVRIATELKLLK